MQSSGGNIDPRVLTSLDRARERPFQHKYIMVDAAAARLYMIEDGRIADSMKVVVGKAGANTQTPMVASTIYYATLNPYWHVSSDLVRSLIAKNVLDQGLGYLSRTATRLCRPMRAMIDCSIRLRSIGMQSRTARFRCAYENCPARRTQWAV